MLEQRNQWRRKWNSIRQSPSKGSSSSSLLETAGSANKKRRSTKILPSDIENLFKRSNKPLPKNEASSQGLKEGEDSPKPGFLLRSMKLKLRKANIELEESPEPLGEENSALQDFEESVLEEVGEDAEFR